MTDELRKRALGLYRGPFKFDNNGGGYIWAKNGTDLSNEIVADGAHVPGGLRVRGWGRISYMRDGAALQEAVGELIAEALTEYWERHATK